MLAVLCTTAAVIALMPAPPAPFAVATAYQTTGLSRIDAASGAVTAARWRGRAQHRDRPLWDAAPHRPGSGRSAVPNAPPVWHARPSLSGAGNGSARGGGAGTGLPGHWLPLLLAAAATAVVGLRRPRWWSLAAVSSASDEEPAGLGLDRGSVRGTNSGRAPAALVAQVEELRGRWLDDLTGRLLSRLKDTGHCDLDEGMRAAARHLEAVIGIGPDELQVLHQNADLPTCSKILEMSDFCRVLGLPADTLVGDKAWAMARKRLLAWNGVRSERDLFLPGLEEFDAKQVYRDELAARRQCLDAVARRAKSLLFEGTSRHPDNLFEESFEECGCRWDQIEEWARVWAAARWHLVGWVCSPAELQARAYFPALCGSADKLLKVAEILEQPEDSAVRLHVLQHRDWWNDLDHSTALDQLEDVPWYSLTLLRGIGEGYHDCLIRAGVRDLRALARLDEGQQRAVVRKLRGISPGVNAAMLQRLVKEAQALVELPPLALDAGAGPQSSTVLNGRREAVPPDVRPDDNVAGDHSAAPSSEPREKLNVFVPEVQRRAHRRATETASATAADLVAECVAQLRDGERHRWLRLVAERYGPQVQESLSGDDDGRDLADSLGEGMHVAVRNLQTVTGIDMDLLNALHHRGTCIGDESVMDTSKKLCYSQDETDGYQRFLATVGPLTEQPAEYLPHDEGLALLRHRLLAWVPVKRGRDLFICGLGGFDIKDVLDHTVLLRRSFMEEVARRADDALSARPAAGLPFRRTPSIEDLLQLSAFVRWHPVTWLPSPAELQAYAYFDALRGSPTKLQSVVNILSLPEGNVVRAHLIRHRYWWNDLDHANALDELEGLLGPAHEWDEWDEWDEEWDKQDEQLSEYAGVFDLFGLAQLNKEQQLAVIPELEGMDQATLQELVEWAKGHVESMPLWPEGGEGLHPRRLLQLLRRARSFGPNVRFDFLKDLIDGAVEADGQQLRVLRDSDSVRDVAERLRNCAAMYSDDCARGTYILVALFDARGRPKALGGYELQGAGRLEQGWRTWSVDQVVGHNNTDPASNVLQMFTDYVAVVQRWEDQRRPADPTTAPVPV